MADKKNIQEPGKIPEKRIQVDQQVRFENEPAVERKENTDEKIITEELRREIEMMHAEKTLEKEAEKKSQEISFLGEKEKLKHLLDEARKKGVVYAIQLAKRMNDPYLLDTLHDILAKEGFYLKFSKPSDDGNDN